MLSKVQVRLPGHGRYLSLAYKRVQHVRGMRTSIFCTRMSLDYPIQQLLRHHFPLLKIFHCLVCYCMFNYILLIWFISFATVMNSQRVYQSVCILYSICFELISMYCRYTVSLLFGNLKTICNNTVVQTLMPLVYRKLNVMPYVQPDSVTSTERSDWFICRFK